MIKEFRLSLTIQMLIGAVLGVVVGVLLPDFGIALHPIGTVFMQAIKMIVVPLVFASITLGFFRMGCMAKNLGRLATVGFLYFAIATLACSAIGLALHLMTRVGIDATLVLPDNIPQNVATSANWVKFFTDMIPGNIVAAMAAGNLLPVIVFSALLGLALASIGDSARTMSDVLEALLESVFKITGWIIAFSPLAIFAILAWLFGSQGVAPALSLVKVLGVTYLGLGGILLLFIVMLLVAGESPLALMRGVSSPVVLAFTGRSSEATLPLHIEKLIALGTPKTAVSVMLPLGYAFNRGGSVMFVALISAFFADVYQVDLSMSALITILILSPIAIAGCANVPSGGLVAIAVVLAAVGVPVEAVAILAGIDAFFDMGRTAMNVFSNSVAMRMIVRLAGVPSDSVESQEVAVTQLPKASTT